MVRDLTTVERELGFRYELDRDGGHYQRDLPALPARPVRPGAGRPVAAILNARGRERPGDAHGRPFPSTDLRIIERFGPHLSAMTGVRLSTSVEPDRLVKTHCCFCGQQCGIQLKVQGQRGHRLRAVGGLSVQPRHALPQGREALPAGLAPRSPAHRAAARPVGARRASARCRTTRRSRASPPRSRASSRRYGPGAIGVLGGASLTTEKTYLLGKFARVCLKTPFIDYNGRLCMVSAGAGEQEGVRHRPHDQPVVRHGRHRGDLGRRLERRRVLADHDQLHLAGARAGREGHRAGSAHHADRAHVRSVPAGEAGPRRGAVRRRAAADDRARLDRPRLHRRAHGRLRRRSPSTAASGRPRAPPRSPACRERSLLQAAEWWGTAKTSFLFHARGIEHHSNGVQNALGTINLVLASGRIGKPKSGYGTIVGQANGQGGREHGQKCDQLPGWRDITQPRAPQVHRRRLGHRRDRSCPGPGVDAYEMFRKIDAGEIKGLLVDLLQPEGLAARQPLRHALPRQARVLRRHRLLPERHRPPRRHRAARQPAGGGRGHGHAGRGPRHQDQQGRRLSRRGARRTGASSRTSPRRSAGRTGSRSTDPREIFEELRVASKGGVADYSGITYEKIEQQMGVFWPCYSEDPRTGEPTPDHPGTPRLFEPGSYNPVAKGAGPFYFPDGKARFNVADYRPPVDDASDEYPIFLTTGRVVSQFLSGTQTRRIGPLVEAVPRAAHRDASAARRRSSASPTATGRPPRRAAATITLRGAGRDDDPARHDLHPLPLGRATRAPTS